MIHAPLEETHTSNPVGISVGYYNHYVKGCHTLSPAVQQEKGTIEFRLGSGSVPCVVVLLDNHVALHR